MRLRRTRLMRPSPWPPVLLLAAWTEKTCPIAMYSALHTPTGDPAVGWEFFVKGAPALAAAMTASRTPAKALTTWSPAAYGRNDYDFRLWEAERPEDVMSVIHESDLGACVTTNRCGSTRATGGSRPGRRGRRPAFLGWVGRGPPRKELGAADVDGPLSPVGMNRPRPAANRTRGPSDE
jgi:hypothetical protein